MQRSSEWAACRPLLQNVQMRIVDGRRLREQRMSAMRNTISEKIGPLKSSRQSRAQHARLSLLVTMLHRSQERSGIAHLRSHF